MSGSEGETVAGGEDGAPPGFMAMGDGVFVRSYTTPSGYRYIHVLDRSEDRRGYGIEVERLGTITELMLHPPDKN
jgi:hypothetical protein